MKLWMASLSSWRERKTPRLRRRLVSSANKPSTALQAVGPPDALYRTDADPDRFGHGCARPMGGVFGRSRQGQGHHALGNLGSQRRDARGPRLVPPQGGDAKNRNV